MLLHELAAAGTKVRVVSMPCWELFEEQSAAYKASVLGGKTTKRLSIEAGTTIGWQRYSDAQIGVDQFGESGPGNKVLERYGFTVANVVEQAKALLASN